MKRIILIAMLCAVGTVTALSQNTNVRERMQQIRNQGGKSTSTSRSTSRSNNDMKTMRADGKTGPGEHVETPRGLKVWTVDERFGDRTEQEPDTVSHMFMNTIFTTGLRGEYNALGNIGSPRLNRIFIDRNNGPGDFMFLAPYDQIIVAPYNFHFTNTLSPITNLTFNTCGDRTNGEDHLTTRFATNAGKRIGAGFKFDYLYGRGYYSNQSTSHFDYTMYGSYIGDRYQAHLLMSLNHQKVAENGGITDDRYITQPERFNETYTEDEIPTVLSENWNRNDNQHVFLTHRYSVGFKRKVPMTEDEIKAKKFAMESQKENEAKKAKEKARKEAEERGEEFDEKEYDRQQANQGRPDDPRSKGRPDKARIAGKERFADMKNDSTLRHRMGDVNVDMSNDSTQRRRIAVTGKAQADSLIAAEGKQAAENDSTLWLKDEYVPVTSFIHTAQFDNYRRIYQAYQTPANFYLNTYDTFGSMGGDSIYDKTRHWELKNTLAVAMLEGFNKWAKAGIKLFATHSLRQFILPGETAWQKFNENAISVGGQLSKTQGSLLHYNVTGEVGVVGDDAGEIHIDADADLNFRLFSDTVQLAAKAFFYREQPSFYLSNYQSKHFWWDLGDSQHDITHTRLEGLFSLQRTRTRLRVAVDEISNYTYLATAFDIDPTSYARSATDINVRQSSDAINLLTVQLQQDFRFGIFNWENEITYQHSSKKDILPVPDLNVYTNLYLKFKIARVLKCDLGADVRYFTKYHAPEYCPAIGMFAVQETEASRTEVGNYPIVNVYANFHLQHTRFFVMMTHVNCSGDGGDYFLTPHYPLNQRILRFGLSWNFFN